MHHARLQGLEGLTHIVGPQEEVGREDEEHEVDDSVQQEGLLECTLQVVPCTEVSPQSAHTMQASRFDVRPLTLRVAECLRQGVIQ